MIVNTGHWVFGGILHGVDLATLECQQLIDRKEKPKIPQLLMSELAHVKQELVLFCRKELAALMHNREAHLSNFTELFINALIHGHRIVVREEVWADPSKIVSVTAKVQIDPASANVVGWHVDVADQGTNMFDPQAAIEEANQAAQEMINAILEGKDIEVKRTGRGLQMIQGTLGDVIALPLDDKQGKIVRVIGRMPKLVIPAGK